LFPNSRGGQKVAELTTLEDVRSSSLKLAGEKDPYEES
jgi:hypothetical protein